ncbi:MAG: O-antigen ligase family protein [Acidobacteria bacterium]|nr:O-antigen ligase family protein [Acidobacteriota bacterium]
MSESFYPEDYEPVRPARRAAAGWEQGSDETEYVGATSRRGERVAQEIEPGQLPESAPSTVASGVSHAKDQNWLARRGHAVTYVGLFLFTLVAFTRPADWYPNAFTESLAFYLGIFTLSVYGVTQLMREGNLTARPREVYYVLALLVAGFLSIPFADQWRDYAYDTFMDTFARAILMFIVLVNVAWTERRLRLLMKISLGVGVFLAASALSDYVTGNLLVEGYRVKGVIGGMFGNPNDLSQHFNAMLPVAVAFLCVSRGILRKIFYALCALALVSGVVVTFSRGGFLTLMTITLVLAWKLGRRHRLFFLSLVLAAGIMFLAAAPGEYRTRLLSMFDDQLEVASGSRGARSELLKESVKVALRHPLLGIGMGNFRLIYKLMTHNSYTQVAAEMGLFGFFAYLLFIVTPLKRLWEIERATRGDPARRRFYFMAIGMQAALAGYMVSSFFGAVAYYFNIYYLVGYAVCLRMIYYTEIGIPRDATGLPQAGEDEREPRTRARGRRASVATELPAEVK